MDLKEQYRWEAEDAAGEIITEGGVLVGCVRFSLIPSVVGLPPHDFTGIPMVRRFDRVFERTALIDAKKLPGWFEWAEGSRVVGTELDQRECVSVGARISEASPGEDWWVVLYVEPNKIILLDPYTGPTTRIESQVYLPPKPSERLHCIVCEGFRIYVRYSDGAVLVTPADYELYL